MLDKALSHAMISYLHGRGEEIPLLDNSVDVITFAGSPFYIKSDALVDEMRRVCRVQARIIAYDFEIALDDIFMQLNVKPTKEKSNYDHNANFSDSVVFKAIVTGKEQVHFEVTATQLTHILLSNFQRYEAFREKYGVIDPNSSLMSELQEISTKYMLNAMTYFSKYELDPFKN